MKKLNIIGCGKVGQCLGALLVEQQVVDQVTICNRSIESATRAQRILGSAAIVEQISQLPCADLWMIACDDRAIPGVVETLAGLTTLSADACIFHVSGALDSHVLEPLSCSGAALGTLHPIRSFADPEHAFRAFPGTVCAVEGDARAVRSLTELCETIGGRSFEITNEAKMVCHAGHVFASNYIVAVLDVAQRLYRSAGLSEQTIQSFFPSIVQGTVDNVLALGTTRALTGLVIRGEVDLVSKQIAALHTSDASLAELYRALAQQLLEITKRRGDLSSAEIDAMSQIISRSRTLD
jgi:predicted short-subunit dehydrogenase-like oxidoreductase (DUF2520 family)